MPFTKGDKNINRNGRKKGTPNKVTTEIRTKIEALIYEQTENINEDLMKLTPKDRVRAYTELLKYVIPTKKDIEVKDNTPETLQRFLELDENEIRTRLSID